MYKKDGNFPYETYCQKCGLFIWHDQGYDTKTLRRMLKCQNCGCESDELTNQEWSEKGE